MRRMVQPTPATFAAYLFGRLPAEAGFAAGPPPEAAPLAQACAAVLWRKVPDSRALVKLEIGALVDREAWPDAVFPWPLPQVLAVGERCRRLAGKSMLGLVDNQLRITIIECARQPLGPADLARLQALRAGGTGVVLVQPVYVDVGARSVWPDPIGGAGAGVLAALAGADGLLEGVFSWPAYLSAILWGQPPDLSLLAKR